MLRNRSRRAVTSKQALMADHHPSLFSPKNSTSSISSFLGSPRFLNGFLSKNHFDPESTAMSMTPTSILDTKNSSSFVNPFAYDTALPQPSTPSPEKADKLPKTESHGIGLALIDSITEEKTDGNLVVSKPINRMVLFGSKLKVQIPNVNNPHSPLSPNESPKSPADFGIKTRNSQPLSPFVNNTPVKEFTRQLSLKEMELSEDYTCVITHGPNPKTRHIFDDCIVESCDVDVDDSYDDGTNFNDQNKMECDFQSNSNAQNSKPVDFLSFCHACKESLEQGKDIFMYRGDKAFCSQECRDHEMLMETKNSDMDDDSL